MRHIVLTTVNPIEIHDSNFFKTKDNNSKSHNFINFDLQNWVNKQTRFDMVFYINPSPVITDAEYYEFIKILDNQIDCHYFSDFEYACELLKPLLKNERLFVNVVLYRSHYCNKMSVSYNVKTLTVYNSYFGFDLKFDYEKNTQNVNHYFVLNQYNYVQRQQVYHSNHSQVFRNCTQLGFSVAHSPMNINELNCISNFYGLKSVLAIPKVCSGCKYYVHDSLESCAVNLTNISLKIKPDFNCFDYEFDTAYYNL
jgi:hypothetical protein